MRHQRCFFHAAKPLRHCLSYVLRVRQTWKNGGRPCKGPLMWLNVPISRKLRSASSKKKKKKKKNGGKKEGAKAWIVSFKLPQKRTIYKVTGGWHIGFRLHTTSWCMDFSLPETCLVSDWYGKMSLCKRTAVHLYLCMTCRNNLTQWKFLFSSILDSLNLAQDVTPGITSIATLLPPSSLNKSSRIDHVSPHSSFWWCLSNSNLAFQCHAGGADDLCTLMNSLSSMEAQIEMVSRLDS